MEYPLTAFRLSPKTGKRGGVCWECKRERKRQWTLANADRLKEYKRKWEDANRGLLRERRAKRRLEDPEFHEAQKRYYREWYAQNREAEMAKQAAYRAERRSELSAKAVIWAQANPDKRRSISFADKARRRGAEVDENAREYAKILRRDPCSYCGNGAGEVDHIVPIATRPDGSWENLTSACRGCNARKHARSLLVFLAA